MSSTENIKEQFEIFLSENEKFESGNAIAGRRARKALMEIAKLAKQRRVEIQEIKKARKK